MSNFDITVLGAFIAAHALMAAFVAIMSIITVIAASILLLYGGVQSLFNLL